MYGKLSDCKPTTVGMVDSNFEQELLRRMEIGNADVGKGSGERTRGMPGADGGRKEALLRMV